MLAEKDTFLTILTGISVEWQGLLNEDHHPRSMTLGAGPTIDLYDSTVFFSRARII